MSVQDAQKCLALGMRLYTSANSGGCAVAHLDNDGEGIRILSYDGEYARAVIMFCNGVKYLDARDRPRNLERMRTVGKRLLQVLEEENDGRQG